MCQHISNNSLLCMETIISKNVINGLFFFIWLSLGWLILAVHYFQSNANTQGSSLDPIIMRPDHEKNMYVISYSLYLCFMNMLELNTGCQGCSNSVQNINSFSLQLKMDSFFHNIQCNKCMSKYNRRHVFTDVITS